MKALVYDLEIINAIPNRNEPQHLNTNYCEGWHDHKGMGVSVLCAYDFHERRFRTFLDDNKEDFFALAHDRLLVTFNGLSFDNKILAACWGGGIEPSTTEQLLKENAYDIRMELVKTERKGKLDDCGKHNFGETKQGIGGAMAPIAWQQGKIGSVIDYCLQDVKLTANLFLKVLLQGGITSPSGSGAWIPMLEPHFETPVEKGELSRVYL